MVSQSDQARWQRIVAQHQKSSAVRAVWQLLNTLVPYAALWFLMYLSLDLSWWLTAPLAVLAGAFLVRIFIIFHDCGHGSYFKSQRANDVVGFVAGVLTFTPYHHWRWEHAIHHGSTGNLDKRGTGDLWTMTVQEYLQSSRWKRFAYQLARNPVVLFVIAPLFVFLIMQRVPNPRADPRERHSVAWTNFAIVVVGFGLSLVFGFVPYVVIQLIVMMIAGAAGVWIFYVQHQFEDAYWERGKNWDYVSAALKGSSYYKLPKILQWFTGSIGFHHIHHLSTRVPNYNLQRCHEADPLFQAVKPTTLFSSLRLSTLRLWDEKAKRLVGFAHLRQLRAQEVVVPVRRRPGKS